MIEKIKGQDLAKYIGGEQERCGRNMRVNPCPLCGHRDCFTVYSQTNTYHCFSCGKSGSIIDYVIDTGGARDSWGAIQVLAKNFNIEMEKTGSRPGATMEKGGAEQEAICRVHQLAQEFYHQQLVHNKAALSYLTTTRGRSLELIESEGYGYAGSSYGLTAWLSQKKIPLSAQIASGMVMPGKNADDRPRDFFGAGYVLYPSWVRGQVCDWTAKPIDKSKNPYRLRSEYRLRNCQFYGQNALYARDEIILVEGQEDRNSILELGNYAVAAILGGLGDEQVSMLQERCEGKRVYLCMDADEAGEKYTEKLIRALSGTAQVHVVDILTTDQKVKDIDDLLRAIDPAERKGWFDRLLGDASDPISWLLGRIPDEDMGPYKMKMVLQPIIEVIAGEQDGFLRSAYIGQVEQALKRVPKVATMITRAVRERNKGEETSSNPDEYGELSVIRRGSQYYKLTNESMKVISDFVMTIHRYIEDEDVRYYEVTLHTFAGASKPIVMSNEQRINMRLFDAALSAVGPYYFYGSLNDLKEVWQLEEERAAIKSYTCRFNRYGWIAEHGIWLFNNCAYAGGKMYLPEKEADVIEIGGIGYQSKNVRVFGGDLPELCVEEKPSLEYTHRVVELIWQMWDGNGKGTPKTFKGFLAAGFMAACVYLQEICRRENKFPYLLAFGPPGTGKSEAMQFIMNMWGFRNGGENWGEATPAGISMAMEQLCSIPYWIEEFSNTMGASTNQQRKVELLKNVYNRVSAGKGGIHGRTVYQVNAALFLTGQDCPENQALLSRCVVLRKETPTENGSEAYFHLKAEGRRLSLVLRWLLEHKNEAAVDNFWANYESLTAMLKERIKARAGDYNERTLVNYAIIATGFSMYGYDQHDAQFVDWLVEQCVEDVNRKRAEDIVYRFFSDIEPIFQDRMAEVISRGASEVYIAFEIVYNEWVKNLRSTGMNEYIGKGGLLDYLRKDVHDYWIAPTEKQGSHRKYFGSYNNKKQWRCIGLWIDRLPEHIREIVNGWDVPTELV